METRVENIESPEYAKIIVLRLVTDKGNSIRVDVPLRLLDEAGIRIEKDDLIKACKCFHRLLSCKSF